MTGGWLSQKKFKWKTDAGAELHRTQKQRATASNSYSRRQPCAWLHTSAHSMTPPRVSSAAPTLSFSTASKTQLPWGVAHWVTHVDILSTCVLSLFETINKWTLVWNQNSKSIPTFICLCLKLFRIPSSQSRVHPMPWVGIFFIPTLGLRKLKLRISACERFIEFLCGTGSDKHLSTGLRY